MRMCAAPSRARRGCRPGRTECPIWAVNGTLRYAGPLRNKAFSAKRRSAPTIINGTLPLPRRPAAGCRPPPRLPEVRPPPPGTGGRAAADRYQGGRTSMATTRPFGPFPGARRRPVPRAAPPARRDGPPRRRPRPRGRARRGRRRRRLPGGEPLRRPRRRRDRRRAARGGAGRPRGPRPPGHPHDPRRPPPRRRGRAGVPPAGAPGGAFTRTVQLPYRVDPDRVEARLEDGVLRLSLGRPEQDKPRRIEIRG
jgi:hypothetical protein